MDMACLLLVVLVYIQKFSSLPCFRLKLHASVFVITLGLQLFPEDIHINKCTL